MKILKYSLLLLAGLVIFSSCEKEQLTAKKEIEIKTLDTTSEEDKEKDDDKKGCFELLFPVIYILPDGTTVSGNDETELDAEIKAWYEAHPDVKKQGSYQYPIDIIWDEDKTETIINEEEMKKAKAWCDDDKKEKWDCFELIYPVSYTMPDGSTIAGDSEEELEGQMKAWYEAHPDVKEEPTLQYPVDIVFAKENATTINNEDEMRAIKALCADDKEKEDCFDLVYPVSYTMPDGSTITGNSGEELEGQMKAWYEAHPDVKEEPTLQYPVEIVFADGTTVTINNEEEMRGAKARCEDDGGGEYDCPDLQADFGAPCRLDDGTEGHVNEDCKCE